MDSNNPNREDTERVQKAKETLQSYDEQFAWLWERYRERVERHCFRILNNEADAQDITSQVYLRARMSLGSLQASEAFWSWLRKIATNLCINHQRAKKNQPAASFDDTATGLQETVGGTDSGLDAVFCADQLREIIKRAKTDLDAKDWETFRHVISGKVSNPADLKRVMDIPYTTAQYRWKCLQRWLHRIRKEVLGR